MIMKRKTIIGSGIVLIGMLVSGLAASVAWFLAGDNTFKTDVNGSVVEEYFHCGNGTHDYPFVITRPMHYYHLVEFFQRKTVLPVSVLPVSDEGNVEYNVTFGTDYLYFQIGYELDGNPANGLEVYDYDNDGTYNDNTSKVLNMAYFSGDNALMPIGTSECPFFGYFDGGATDDANAIKIQNLNIKSQEDVIVEGGSSLTTRYTSDVGMFGYVADNDGDSNTTSINNIYIDGLDIDLTGAVAGKDAVDAESVSHSSEHDDKIYVGYIVGHMHTYTRYDSAGPTNSSPIHDVYINNATIKGGSSATCNFGYVGHADTINGVSGDEIDLTEIINELAEAAGGGGGHDDDWGGSFNSQDYTDWAFDLFGYTSGTADSPNEKTVSNEYKLSLTNSEVMNPNGSIMLYSGTKYYYLFNTNGTGVYKRNGVDYNFTWSFDPNARYHPYIDGFKVNLSQSISFSGGTTSTIYLHAENGSATALRQYSLSNGYGSSTGTNGLLESRAFSLRNSVYRLRNTSYIPLRFSDDSKTATHLKNTGYIVGTNISTGENASPKIASYGINHINQSISDTSVEYNDIAKGKGEYEYVDSNLEVLTYHNGNWVCIKDSHNAGHPKANAALNSYTKSDATTPASLGFLKYDASRTTIGNIFENNHRLHGIHFDTEFSGTTPLNVIGNYNAQDTRNTTKGLGVASGIKINETAYNQTYYLPKGSIDFHLKKTGIINFFAGTFSTTSSVTFNFFSLYQVFRTLTNNQYTYTVKELDSVYRNKYWNSSVLSDAATNPKYFYKYKDGSFSNIVVNSVTRAATLSDRDTNAGNDGVEFDASILRATAPVKNALYYFEIPVNNGEFAMGYVSTTTANTLQGAYLLYLDIGANADVIAQDYDTENKISQSAIFTQIEYLSSGYVINSCFNIAYVIPEGATKETFSIKVSRVGTVFSVEVVNTTANVFRLHVLLVDNNDDPDDEYPYSYTLKYNTGEVSTPYVSSGSYQGAASGTQLAPLST